MISTDNAIRKLEESRGANTTAVATDKSILQSGVKALEDFNGKTSKE